MSAGREDRWVVGPNVTARQFDDELVILDLAGGNYFALNEVGARMWHALARGSTPEEIVESLATEYEVERDSLLSDCLRLVEELVRRQLISKVTR
jgi:hypothetical protein